MSSKRTVPSRKGSNARTQLTNAPVACDACPIRYAGGAQAVLLIFAFALPLLYDPTVLEVAGDIRATATHLAAGSSALIIIASVLIQRRVVPLARLPLICWLALLLAVWA